MISKELKQMIGSKKISFAQNFEDIILARVLNKVDKGFYIDIGAAWPEQHSVSKLFYDMGWNGVNVEPNKYMLRALDTERPRDVNLGVGVSDEPGLLEFYCFENLGLSSFSHEVVLDHLSAQRIEPDLHEKQEVEVVTLDTIFDNFVEDGQSVHFLKIDAEGFESKILASNDWSKNRPWIVVYEATKPGTAEEIDCDIDQILLSNGYKFSYFDQLNRFYVASEKEGELCDGWLPPSSFDEFVKYEDVLPFAEESKKIAEKAGLVERELYTSRLDSEQLRKDLDQVLHSKSWFITKPFRFLMRLLKTLNSYELRGKLIVFAASSKIMMPVKRVVNKSPLLKSYLVRKLFHAGNGGADQYKEIVLHGLKINVYKPAMLDVRGIGRVTKNTVEELSKRAASSTGKVSQSVYFYPALNICPKVLEQPSVVVVHDTIPLDFQELFPDSIVSEWKSFGKVLSQASKIVAISDSSAADLVKHFGVARSKVEVIYNGVTKPSKSSSSNYQRPGRRDRSYFVMLGSTDFHKNTEMLLEVWSEAAVSEQFDLLIVGESSKISEIWANDLPGGVHIAGYLSNEELSGLLSEAKALLFPSLKEGFGLPPFEAALLGVPTISSNRPAMNDLLSDAALFVDAEDKQGWIDAIFRISSNDELRLAITERALEKASKLSVERNVDSLVSLLDSVASSQSGIDLFMRSAMEEVVVSSLKGIKVVPLAILGKLPNTIPYVASFYFDLTEIDLVMIHKGEIDYLPSRLLKYVNDSLKFVYGNPVYNVYVVEREGVSSVGSEHQLNLQEVIESRRENLQNDSPEPRKTKIGVVTANHMGNIGDDAITHAAVSMLERAYPDAIIELAPMPFNRKNYSGFDVLVIGGGGLFYDADFSNAANYCNVMLYAKELGKKCFCIGVGVQGIRTDIGKELYRQALDTVDYIAVRDKIDKEILESIGVQSEIMVTQDLVFSLPYRPTELLKLNRNVERKRPTAIIALLDSRNLLAARHMVTYQQALEESVHFLSKEFDLRFLCQSMDDLELYKELKEQVGGEIIKVGYNELDTIGDIYADGDLVVTSRFHGLIFSILFRKPVLAIGTNGSKIERLISHCFPSLSKSLIPIKAFSLDVFKEKVAGYLDNPDEFIASETERRSAIQQSTVTIDAISAFRN